MTISDKDIEDFLEHHGVKGMKWGQRRAHRSQMRSLNKASRQKDRAANKEAYKKAMAKQAKDVDRARANIQSGKNRKAYQKAKAQYKVDKNVIGKREAKKAFNKVKDKNFRDYQKSQEFRDNKEVGKYVALAVVANVGGAVLRAQAKNM